MTRPARTAFQRFIGIDYSGAATPDQGLTGLRVCGADPGEGPREIRPTMDGRRHWTRRSLAQWLERALRTGPPALVGIDHGFSFPRAWFERYGITQDWSTFLADFRRHWPTHRPDVTVEAVRRGEAGAGASRGGDARWRREAERRTRAAKSVFHFDVPGSVAKSTHAGLPWLAELREDLGDRLHCWPFDGWRPRPDCHVLAEVYPALWPTPARKGENDHQRDARAVAETLRAASDDGRLDDWLQPALDPETARTAEIEGWILGVV